MRGKDLSQYKTLLLFFFFTVMIIHFWPWFSIQSCKQCKTHKLFSNKAKPNSVPYPIQYYSNRVGYLQIFWMKLLFYSSSLYWAKLSFSAMLVLILRVRWWDVHVGACMKTASCMSWDDKFLSWGKMNYCYMMDEMIWHCPTVAATIFHYMKIEDL